MIPLNQVRKADEFQMVLTEKEGLFTMSVPQIYFSLSDTDLTKLHMDVKQYVDGIKLPLVEVPDRQIDKIVIFSTLVEIARAMGSAVPNNAYELRDLLLARSVRFKPTANVQGILGIAHDLVRNVNSEYANFYRSLAGTKVKTNN